MKQVKRSGKKPNDEMILRNSNPALLLGSKRVHRMLRLYLELCHLKQLLRQGWVKRNLPSGKCESVGDHVFLVALLSMVYADEYLGKRRIDFARLLKMALIHDVAEIYYGDKLYGIGESVEEKDRAEMKIMKSVWKGFKNRIEYIELFRDYQESKSPEAKLLKQVDKLEGVFQAGVYELQGYPFFDEYCLHARDRKLVSDKAMLGLIRKMEILVLAKRPKKLKKVLRFYKSS